MYRKKHTHTQKQKKTHFERCLRKDLTKTFRYGTSNTFYSCKSDFFYHLQKRNIELVRSLLSKNKCFLLRNYHLNESPNEFDFMPLELQNRTIPQMHINEKNGFKW